MATATVEVPEELLRLLKRSGLAKRSEADQVAAALAIHLFLEGIISIGKAAELAGEGRLEFESLVASMGLPVVQYELADCEQDARGFAEAEKRSNRS